MKRFLTAIIFSVVLSLHAVTQPRGDDRLRELVVFPEINLKFNFGMAFQGNKWIVQNNLSLPDEISRLREELKQQPDDVKLLLQFGNLLDSNDATNESKGVYEKAEQLCRNKLVATPLDGSTMLDLGEALAELDKNEEAESVYRKATTVSSNDWRCWVGLGNFLANGISFFLPKNLRAQIDPGQLPSQEIWDYHPSKEDLIKAKSNSIEASRCFDRAVALAPRNPELFFQRAGYICSSNMQNLVFRHFHDHEEIDARTMLLSFYSKEMIADLCTAAELSPENYQYISLAAYFKWMSANLQAKSVNLTMEALPEATRQSIREAITRLESLSRDADKKTEVGALENLSMLNGYMGSSPATAVPYLRRAVSLDPTRDQSWDLLLGVLSNSASPEELTTLCQSRLKSKDSARNRLLLAKALSRQEKWVQAGEEAESAIKLEPDNLIAHLELLALALKQSADSNYLAKASEQIQIVGELIKNKQDDDEIAARWRESTLNQAIFDDLFHTPEGQQMAKECIEAVLKDYPNDTAAKQIAEALN